MARGVVQSVRTSFFFGLTASLATLVPAGAARADARGEAIWAQTLAALGRTQNLTAQMRVSRQTGGGAETRAGRVVLSRPNFAHADLNGHTPLSLVATGRAIFLVSGKAYQYSPLKSDGANLGEALNAPLVTFYFKPDAASLAPGYSGLGKATYKGQETIGGVACDIIEITGTKPARCRITLSVGPDKLPRRSTFRYQITPRFTETVDVQFTSVVVNSKLPATAFHFVPPPGAVNLTPELATPDKPGAGKQQGDPGTIAPDGTIIRP